MAYAEGDESIRGRGRPVQVAQRLAQESLSGKRGDPITRGTASQIAYDLPPLEDVGPYDTRGGCGGRIVPLEAGFHKCQCMRWHPNHAIPRSPSKMQILRARVLLRRALRKRIAERGTAGTLMGPN